MIAFLWSALPVLYQSEVRAVTRASTGMMRRWTSGIPPSPARCSTPPTTDKCVIPLALGLKMAVVHHAAVVALCHQP